MTRQRIAEYWKTETTTYDESTKDFHVETKFFGRYTKQTVIEKMGKKYPNFMFREISTHGFGGYWYDSDGNTIVVSPDFGHQTKPIFKRTKPKFNL